METEYDPCFWSLIPDEDENFREILFDEIYNLHFIHPRHFYLLNQQEVFDYQNAEKFTYEAMSFYECGSFSYSNKIVPLEDLSDFYINLLAFGWIEINKLWHTLDHDN